MERTSQEQFVTVPPLADTETLPRFKDDYTFEPGGKLAAQTPPTKSDRWAVYSYLGDGFLEIALHPTYRHIAEYAHLAVVAARELDGLRHNIRWWHKPVTVVIQIEKDTMLEIVTQEQRDGWKVRVQFFVKDILYLDRDSIRLRRVDGSEETHDLRNLNWKLRKAQ